MALIKYSTAMVVCAHCLPGMFPLSRSCQCFTTHFRLSVAEEAPSPAPDYHKPCWPLPLLTTGTQYCESLLPLRSRHLPEVMSQVICLICILCNKYSLIEWLHLLASPERKIQLQGGITSITLRGEGHHFFVGTEESHIYRVNFTDFKETLIATCHFEAVQDVVFPL